MLRKDTFDPQTVVLTLTVAMPGSVEMLFGLTGHLCGRRLDAWDDGTMNIFAFEVRAIAQRLARWLATMQAAGFEATGITAVHFTAADGRERTAMMRRRCERELRLPDDVSSQAMRLIVPTVAIFDTIWQSIRLCS